MLALHSLSDPVRVARATEDEETSWLVAERADIVRGEYNGPAQIVMIDGEKGGIAPLQQFYKFGAWIQIPLEQIDLQGTSRG